MLNCSLSPSSYPTYRYVWQALHHFYQQVYQSTPKVPLSPHDISWFITYHCEKTYASSTIYTYVASVSHIQCLLSFDNPTAPFLPRKLLNAINKVNPSTQRSFPITSQLLTRMINNMNMIFQDKYILYKALFSSLFYMCAHVGEMVISFTPQNT